MSFQSLIGSDTIRTAAISGTMAIIGWVSHTMLELNGQAAQLQSHDAQIKALFSGQRETHEALQSLTTTVVRVEGKIDVVNQKIDDDRNARRK